MSMYSFTQYKNPDMVDLGRLLAKLGASVLGELLCEPGTTTTIDNHVQYAFRYHEDARIPVCQRPLSVMMAVEHHWGG